MSLSVLLHELKCASVSISLDGDMLRVHAPPGVLSPHLRERLSDYKAELLGWLRASHHSALEAGTLPVCHPDIARRHEPFPLSDMQQGFYMADDPYMEFHVRPHYYIERNAQNLDITRYEAAWNKALQRHRGEIVVVDRDGRLITVRDPAPLAVQRIDLSGLSDAAREQSLAQIRAEMMRGELPLDRWPWLDLRVSLWSANGATHYRIHYNHNNFFSDGYGTTRLLQEIDAYYDNPELERPPLSLGFRDAALTLDQLAQSPAGQQARKYWEDRLPGLPEAPALPLSTHLDRRCRSCLKRRERFIAARTWSAFVALARGHGLTPSNALFTVYAEIVSAWSNSRHFVLSNMMTRRLDMHPEIREIIGNFASLYPLEVDFRPHDRFVDRARRLQEQVLNDARHLHWGGMQVMQTINRGRGGFGAAAVPFVIGSGLFMDGFQKADFSCLETSQVMLDHQFWELADGRLYYVWDLLEEFFLPGVIDAMWDAYADLLERLAHQQTLWFAEALELIPSEQLDARANVCPPPSEPPSLRLESYLATRAQRQAQALAVGDAFGSIDCATLARHSDAIANHLRDIGIVRGNTVAVVANRGLQLVQAVFGILKAGAAYVPVDPLLPDDRRAYILSDCAAAAVLAESCYANRLNWPKALCVLDISRVTATNAEGMNECLPGDNTDLAYLIYTSGSTGKPKGVMIDHRGAVNTIEDVNQRFAVGQSDRIFGVSPFGFDLSVYDLFGSMAAGARLVYPAPEQALNPAHWVDVMQREGITVWNSAPPLALLLAESVEAQHVVLSDLRLVLLSGDWIPLDLPERIRCFAPKARVVSLGGATEASIWSICYDVQTLTTDWTSVPYGFPMQNQPWYILDAWGRQAPDWATGELYIGGIGLAQGYWADPDKTAAAFGRHAIFGELSEQRLYRTGDLGRYRPGGIIEFLGRRDTQVKIQGHRIELGEIESELIRCPGVASAVATVQRNKGSGSPRLLAYVVPIASVELDRDSLREYLAEKLPAYMVPRSIGLLPRLPLSANGKVDRSALPAVDDALVTTAPGLARFEPRNLLESQLRDIWRKVLDRESVDLAGDFFDMGGQSFEAVRIVGSVRHQIGITLSIGAIWEMRSIERLADYLAQTSPTQVTDHHVKLRPAGTGTPLFLAHPAGGHVMCYRDLADSLERPVIAFQAAGLDGVSTALNSIESMASQYVIELLRLQPNGSVFLGGWSSGALIAFEMAAQLQRMNRSVSGLVLIDCPAPLIARGEVDDVTLLAWFLEDLALGISVQEILAQLDLREMEDAAQLQLVSRRLRELAPSSHKALDELLAVYRVFKGVVRGSRHYQPSALDIDLLVVRAEDGEVSEFASHPHDTQADWGWGELTEGHVETCRLAGTHHSLLLPPQLSAVAKTLATWIDAHDLAGIVGLAHTPQADSPSRLVAQPSITPQQIERKRV